jgi:hypothetical protein
VKTTFCIKCNNSGITTRYTNTSKKEGKIILIYSPKEPKICNCIKTREYEN